MGADQQDRTPAFADFWCPGCGRNHCIDTAELPEWWVPTCPDCGTRMTYDGHRTAGR